MSEPASDSDSEGLFNVARIRRLAELMNEQDLSEIELEDVNVRLRLRRKLEAAAAPEPPPARAAAAPAPTPPPAAAPAKTDDPGSVIKSPMVGTFYISPNPESPAFIKVGDHVGPETVVCIIEAMKVFNEIPAETAGKIVAVLVENGAPVEYGQPLFRIDRSG